ncbi:hypothetical protein PSN13_06532 [Micromonospora saelicesensis]|uniref:Uncharacterized protein n=1 Tax=Micromonospora saelicesensis TaxID=285676 RepID=A0A328NIZ4_9ACTN|nr:hypothetical protein [Micromonospora saelicesensis]RAO26504.1 hypothetical protein PSN13_06532 [Micromonospora saelicesensis]
MNTDAIAAALTDAMPALAGTVFPALICIGAAAALEWHRLGEDDDYTVDDYKPATTARAAVYRYQAPVDGPTQVIRRALPDAGTPVYDQLAARATAHQWLRDIAATHTFMHNTNEGSVR